MTTLTADNEQLLQELVSTGQFATTDEAIRESLLAMKLRVLQSEVDRGLPAGFGVMKGLMEIKGDIVSPIPGWFDEPDEP